MTHTVKWLQQARPKLAPRANPAYTLGDKRGHSGKVARVALGLIPPGVSVSKAVPGLPLGVAPDLPAGPNPPGNSLTGYEGGSPPNPFSPGAPALPPPVDAPQPSNTFKAGNIKQALPTAVEQDPLSTIQGPGATLLAPKDLAVGDKYDFYKNVIASRWGKLQEDLPTLLALRGINARGKVHRTIITPELDDTLVVLSKDKDGQPHVTEMAGNTHPAQTQGRGRHPGMVNPGRYEAFGNVNEYGGPSFRLKGLGLNGDSALPSVRDFDGNGAFSPAERARSSSAPHVRDKSNDGAMTGVLLHRGSQVKVSEDYDMLTGLSIGCLNPEDIKAFAAAVGGAKAAGQRAFHVIVMDANGS